MTHWKDYALLACAVTLLVTAAATYGDQVLTWALANPTLGLLCLSAAALAVPTAVLVEAVWNRREAGRSALRDALARHKGSLLFYVPMICVAGAFLWYGFARAPLLSDLAVSLAKAIAAPLLAGLYDQLPWREIDTIHELKRGNYAYALSLAARTLAIALCLGLG